MMIQGDDFWFLKELIYTSFEGIRTKKTGPSPVCSSEMEIHFLFYGKKYVQAKKQRYL